MAQHLKDEVRQRLVQAALAVFAEQGYAAATIAEIAKLAGVSTGNVYRYFPDKAALFADAVDAAFVRRLRRLLRRRVEAAAGANQLLDLPAGAPHPLASEALLRFCIAERERVIIVLGRARGTHWEKLSEQLVSELVRRCLAHFAGLRPELRVTPALSFTLRRIYENLLRDGVDALAAFRKETEIREAISGYSRYHLAGLERLFQP